MQSLGRRLRANTYSLKRPVLKQLHQINRGRSL